MFTGIIQSLGEVSQIKKNSRSNLLTVKVDSISNFKKMEIGESIAVNGVCLTLTESKNNLLHFDFIDETNKLTNLETLKKGEFVNLERSLTPESKISGHFVAGHIDSTAIIKKIFKNQTQITVYLAVDKERLQYLIKKASITVDGISLTIIDINKFQSLFWVGIIPHTYQNTNLKYKKIGDIVNIEIDMLAKYLKKFATR